MNFLRALLLGPKALIEETQACITKNLDISTAHMDQNDAELLDENDDSFFSRDPIIVYRFDEGYFIYIGGDLDTEAIKDFGYSQEFIEILKWGKNLGCTYVKFDRDGTTYKHLKTFSW